MTLIALHTENRQAEGQFDLKNLSENALAVCSVSFDNTEDVAAQRPAWRSVDRVELQFPKFSDGRAFSQAVLLRRAGFKGDIRAKGDVLVDQIEQMKRCGFSSAELRADQNAAYATELSALFPAFYQGDVLEPKPAFARAEA
jgi:uncharacterized protein (DUF934 family)